MASPLPLPPVEALRAVFQYDAETGELHWTSDKAVPCRVRGKRALGAKSKNGYLFGSYRGQNLMRHRVIWKLVHGEDPLEIDHIDGDQTNNRIENLRSVTHSENCRARGIYSTNTSGVPGVSWIERDQKWMAFIHADGRMLNLGLYGCKEAAITARQVAEDIHAYNTRGVHG